MFECQVFMPMMI